MESVYSIQDGSSSAKIHIGKYFETYHEAIGDEWCKKSHEDGDYSIASYMPSSLGHEELDMLAEYCSIDKLDVPGEPSKDSVADKRGPWSFNVTEIPQGTDLVTLKRLREIYSTQTRSSMQTSRKYLGELTMKYDKVVSDGPFAVPGKDCITYIRVYEPIPNKILTKTVRKLTFSCMIAVLGTQTLDKVRELIECLSDLSIPTEISENPDTPIGPVAKDVYKSGFFYIEGTFYNDFRDPSNIDYSEVIREWAEAKHLGPFEIARMEETRIDSLSVKFGYPYVYQHQGDCEHLLVFSDARLVNPSDELAISAYPRIHRLKQRRSRYCMTCGISAVRWITTDNDRIPHNPCYLCEDCFKSYNYIDGKKVGNFKAYRYPELPLLMDYDPAVAGSSRGKKSSKKKKKKTET